MDIKTLLIFLALYIYGYALMIWAIFFDKNPTKTSVNASKIGLIALTITLVYVVYVLWTEGLL